MSKLSEIVKNLVEKWKGISRNKKIAFSVLTVAIVGALVYAAISLNTTKYEVLFSNMDPADSKTVLAKLDEQKVQYQTKSGSILVPVDQVDKLRLSLAPELTSGSKGWELFDTSKFAPTDREMDVTYQRALEGELERTIKGFPQIENVRVALVLSESSAFVKDDTPGKASVALKIKQGNTVNADQVRAIVSLVSGSVKNLPKENVEVVDDKMQLLSKDIFNQDKAAEASTSTEKQQQIKKSFEKTLESNLNEMLQGVFGKDKVKVAVNAELNFDATEKTAITYDPKSVVRSQQTIRDLNGGQQNNTTSQSPVDNNMSNTTPAQTQNNGTVTHEEQTVNNEISSEQQKTIKAPGEVKRLTTSVVLNSKNLDDATKTAVANLVQGAIGYDPKRGDIISVEAIAFEPAAKTDAQVQLEQMTKAAEQAKKLALYRNIGIGAGALFLLLAMLFLRRKPKRKEEMELAAAGLDVVIGDELAADDEIEYEPIDFEPKDERSHLEKEIKNYASNKPEQVVDIIKSWLAEDER